MTKSGQWHFLNIENAYKLEALKKPETKIQELIYLYS